MAKVEIKLSVGQGGKNNSQDVLLVQMLLNKFIIGGFLDVNALLMDGLAGKKTKQAIKTFQAIFLGHNAPDGKVEPNKATLDALNGPITQLQKGDPDNLVMHSILETLRGSAMQSVRFFLDAYSILPHQFGDLADQFEWRKLRAIYDPSLGDNALYFHKSDGGAGGRLVLGFPKAFTATQKSIVVHEATHAVCDGWAKSMGIIQSETLAHLAQALYYYFVTGHHFSFVYAPTADVLTTAVNVAIRMKLDGNRTVSAAERSELYLRVMKLPNDPLKMVFAYDGW